ncbi:hypothetical protein [Pseudorhodoplanes sinuspersici]|uniref:Uncharacterized protein n=1 Tax=Pseudorhodoplanes sinuspersici TaxID=1235591 RepID=A0A1W6ZXT7_9HYPH|nr:hypothetical protein [Pseudorhodoplanes sinuspersici]ARQ02229.1 hypothetical protein CAK95_26370 [Pseudorhodoplanes sinuspersici]RKE74050.1 hypothetical protein DFP91_1950 [Pseudorhodoplanes sinuspersici]
MHHAAGTRLATHANSGKHPGTLLIRDLTMTRHGFAATAFAIITLFALPAAAQRATGMLLEDAGFKMREANTPEKMERLRSLTPHKLIARQKNGVPYYLYADPDDCKCLFIGDKIAFENYRAMPAQPLQPYDVGRGSNPVVSDMVDEMDRDGSLDQDDMIDPGS